MLKCLNCQVPITSKTAKKFCGQSCAASYNNKGVRRHGKPANDCKICGKKTKSFNEKYCSMICYGVSQRVPEEQKRRANAEQQSRYRAKQYRTLAAGADKELIKQIYQNCPGGHEVDHIIPLSKGGLHHQDNLQYLTITENRKKGNKILVV